MSQISKTKTSFYRRLLVAYLIESGINSVPALMAETGMPRRTAQDTIKALEELDIRVEYIGATKSGQYQLLSWGAINREWIVKNLPQIRSTLGYSG
ncbi:helix-turn-helix domain-containing protein [Dongshaea marina]|uniref:helix-turn-helix domain-containing protein n=1 Tax=Dongshaea marina TaxID=2047966 RepID=UPI000D3E9BB4|nr:helix-turn-helix domain-containing protein [Dongshaea marina]